MGINVEAKTFDIKPTQADIDTAKQTFGVVYPFSPELEGDHEVEFIIRRLKPKEYRRFVEVRSGKGGASKALRGVFADGVVFPRAEQVEGLLEEHPGIADVVAGKILELSGLVEGRLGKAY